MTRKKNKETLLTRNFFKKLVIISVSANVYVTDQRWRWQASTRLLISQVKSTNDLQLSVMGTETDTWVQKNNIS